MQNRNYMMYVCLFAQSCPTLCDLIDCSPPGSSVHGILQARILEWVAIPFSRRSSWPRAGIKCGSPALQAYSLPLVPPIFHKSRENIPMLFWSQEIYLPLCMYVCINLSIHPVFLEKFWIHSKIEQKIQRSCVYLAPIYAQLSPWSTSHTGLVHLLSLMNLTDTTIIIQSLSFTLGFTLGVVYSMDFDKCVMIRIHHCNSRWMLMF